MKTYRDSDPLEIIQRGYNESTRNLMFHSTELPVENLQEALDIIGKYNRFDSKIVGETLLTAFGDEYEYVVGREYSVVIYLIPKQTEFELNTETLTHIKERTLVDEISIKNGRLRLWWD